MTCFLRAPSSSSHKKNGDTKQTQRTAERGWVKSRHLSVSRRSTDDCRRGGEPSGNFVFELSDSKLTHQVTKANAEGLLGMPWWKLPVTEHNFKYQEKLSSTSTMTATEMMMTMIGRMIMMVMMMKMVMIRSGLYSCSEKNAVRVSWVAKYH